MEDLRRSAALLGTNRLLDVRQLVGEAFVAVDTGLAFSNTFLVLRHRTTALLGEVETQVVVTTATFARIGFFHPCPDRFSHLETASLEFLRGIDRAQNAVEQILGGPYLGHHLGQERFGHVTIRTGGAHPGTTERVRTRPVFFIGRALHFMAGNAEGLGIGFFEHKVEACPRDNTGSEQQHDTDPAGCMNPPQRACQKMFNKFDHLAFLQSESTINANPCPA